MVGKQRGQNVTGALAVPRYDHTQKGSRLVYYLSVFFVLEVLLIEAFVYLVGTRGSSRIAPDELWSTMLLIALVPGVILGWAFLMMTSLTVTIDADCLRMRMGPGPGVWRKTFRLDRIVDCRPVTNRWTNGWGIHYIGGRCWLYNIAGKAAVEITFSNGQKVRIGTDQPEALAAAIRAAV